MARTVEEILRVQLGGLMLDLAVQIAAKEAAEEKLAASAAPTKPGTKDEALAVS